MGYPKAMYKAGIPATAQDGVSVLNEGEEALLRERGWLDGIEFHAEINAAEAAKAAERERERAAAIKAQEKEQTAREKADQEAAKQRAAFEAAQKQEEAQRAAVIRRQHLEISLSSSLAAPLQRRLLALGARKRGIESELALAGRDSGAVLEKLTALRAEIADVEDKLANVAR